MDKTEFQAYIKECIKECTSPQEEKMTRGQLKEVVKQVIKAILKEMADLEEEEDPTELAEITTTAASPAINLPGSKVPSGRSGWVSKAGGSERGVAGSKSLGYELTPIGKKDMARPQDKVYEGVKKNGRQK